MIPVLYCTEDHRRSPSPAFLCHTFLAPVASPLLYLLMASFFKWTDIIAYVFKALNDHEDMAIGRKPGTLAPTGRCASPPHRVGSEAEQRKWGRPSPPS